MPGLVPGIHVFAGVDRKTWMAGTSPAMTRYLPEIGWRKLSVSPKLWP
jgi:hypothetical protein